MPEIPPLCYLPPIVRCQSLTPHSAPSHSNGPWDIVRRHESTLEYRHEHQAFLGQPSSAFLQPEWKFWFLKQFWVLHDQKQLRETRNTPITLTLGPDRVTPAWARPETWCLTRERWGRGFSEKFVWSFWQYVRGLAFWIQNIYFWRRKKIFELLNISR